MRKPSLRPYLDSYGLVVQLTTRDGGDTLHRMTLAYYIAYVYFFLFRSKSILEELKNDQVLSPQAIPCLLYAGNGLWRRHVGELTVKPHDMWSHKLDRMSRDQMKPLIPFLRAYNQPSIALRTILGVLARFGFSTNTRRNGSTSHNHGNQVLNSSKIRNYNWKLPDFVLGPEEVATYIRTLNLRVCYPFLYILDLWTVMGTLMTNYLKSDDINQHLVVLIEGQIQMPTITMRLALQLINLETVTNKLNTYWKNEDPTWFSYHLAHIIRELKCSNVLRKTKLLQQQD